VQFFYIIVLIGSVLELARASAYNKSLSLPNKISQKFCLMKNCYYSFPPCAL